jgi:hypothetical protein
MDNKYYEIKRDFGNYHNDEVFYAFSNEQFKEGMKKIPEGAKVYQGFVGGQYGTKEGLTDMLYQLKIMKDKIKAECTPQDIYNYEYANHECGYTGDDSEAFQIVREYFPKADIKRRHGYHEDY